NKLSERDKATFRKLYEPGSVYQRAEQAMRSRAKANDKYALLALALELEHHGTASPKEAQEVFRVVSQAAKLGSPKALLMLGWMYHDGNGVKRDLMEADHYFHLAKDKGNPSALLALANACERGDGEKQDIRTAEKYFKEALRMDLSRAPIAYANFLCYQIADSKSVDTAVAFYKKDSARDQLESMLRLALLYDHGEGVEKNPLEAARLRKKAAEQVMRCKAKDADEYFSRGQSWAELGDSKKAIADFSEALRLKPDFRVGYTAKAAAEQTAGDNRSACKDMSKALELDPNCVQAYLGRAYSNLGLGKAAEALKDSNSILERTSAPDNDRLYGLIIGALACRMLHDEKQAELKLDEAAASCSEHCWPGPIVSYLRHQLSDDQFASYARGYSRSTEVRFYMAMQQSLKGNVNDAIANLAWVKENGDKTFYEYPVAVAELDRLQKAPSRSKY
ncbi:MAG: tetratricopeptide repeat protein, partial [Candidatus Obscuribacterales bacterium]|nr:tetratricopeptide repeat protein [Candidatus Obscuribacterales bacterium]